MILIAYPNMQTTLMSFQFEYWVGDIDKLGIGDDGWNLSDWYKETFIDEDAEALFWVPATLVLLLILSICYCCYKR